MSKSLAQGNQDRTKTGTFIVDVIERKTIRSSIDEIFKKYEDSKKHIVSIQTHFQTYEDTYLYTDEQWFEAMLNRHGFVLERVKNLLNVIESKNSEQLSKLLSDLTMKAYEIENRWNAEWAKAASIQKEGGNE